ncbi:MAG: glycosyltransferase [Bacilli bacterium]|nr:glycosyltransferase [Bacilli bacterium]
MKISAIIPVYNGEKFIERCLDSILNQSFDDFEIIAINDGSTDNSRKIIEKYVKEYPLKVSCYNQKNKGQSVARNRGLDLAQGKYITFIDSDDWIDGKMFEHMYLRAINSDADIITCDYVIAYPGNVEVIRKGTVDFADDPIKNFIMSVPGPCAKLYKSKLWENQRFPVNIIYEDFALIPLIGAIAKKIVNIDKAYYYYYQRENSTINQKGFNPKYYDIFEAADYLYNGFQSSKYFDQYIDEVEFLVINQFLYNASIRFLPYKNKRKNIKKIVSYINEKFPKWSENKYYNNKMAKYEKVNCFLISKNLITCLYFYRYFMQVKRRGFNGNS